jgi:hypothetical protein
LAAKQAFLGALRAQVDRRKPKQYVYIAAPSEEVNNEGIRPLRIKEEQEHSSDMLSFCRYAFECVARWFGNRPQE